MTLAGTPAPDSTRIVWPCAFSFLVVSGVAATRVSPAAVSRGTPINMFLSPRPSRDDASLQEEQGGDAALRAREGPGKSGTAHDGHRRARSIAFAPARDRPAPAMTSPRPHRIVVGLSGGVDSAVTAWLLKRAGHEVVGIFMKNWEEDDDDEYCSSRQDFLDAASVADVIGIELEHVNFAAEYKDRVFAEFLREYQAGERPTPTCCATPRSSSRPSSTMRSGSAPSGSRPGTTPASGRAAEVGRALRAAQGARRAEGPELLPASLSQAQLARTLFPIGELAKTEVRRIAAEIGLPNARKKDSTGICFIGERPFREFLNRYLANTPGPIEDERGRTIGEHVGLSFYTLGQRKGIGIGGLKDPSGMRVGGEHAPWFVARKDLARNVLHVVAGHDHPGCCRAGSSPTTRAGSPDGARGGPLRGEDALPPGRRGVRAAPRRGGGRDRARFDRPQWAVTPGQSAVVYDGEVCLGGAVIAASDAHNVSAGPRSRAARRIPARRPLTARRA